MFRRFSLLLIALLLPALAGAANMQVTSSALPATGGSINPNGLKFFATAATYAITVNPGWSIGSVLIDSVVKTNSTSQTVPFDTSKPHTVKVTFTQASYSISTLAGAGGQLQITGGGSTAIPAGSARTIIVAPSTGYQINSYIVDNGTPVVPAVPTVAASIPFNNIQASHSVSATFVKIPPSVLAYAGSNQDIYANISNNASATLNGSGSTNRVPSDLTYQWNVMTKPSGATAVFGTPNSAVTSFSVNKTGTYQVMLTATSGGVSVNSTVVTITVQSATAAGVSSCIKCHTGGVEVAGWQGSLHYSNSKGPNCVTCHMPTGLVEHPGIRQPIDSCKGCHLDTNGSVPRHPVAIGTNTCVSCHNPHTTIGVTSGMPLSHYNNLTSAGYPASYITTRSTCMDCHFDSPANLANRGQWAKSGHANTRSPAWTSNDFKTMAGCVQCHTTTGFIAYSTGKVTAAWGVASDKGTKELLTCVGCHTDISTGTVAMVTPVRPFAHDTYLNKDVHESNLCMDCHSGANNGKSIVSNNFTNQQFIAPHSLSAGGTIHGKSGYHFTSGGKTYSFYSSNSHRRIGMGNVNGTGFNGPCVACHMSATEKHRFMPVTIDASGAITGLTTTLCADCHINSLTVPVLATDQTDYDNALNVLKAMLTYKGFVFNLNLEVFFANTDWGNADTMGAAFNYVLFLKEPGAYAHNPAYARTLITDSVDYLYNGTLTGSIDTALAELVAKGKISQADAEKMKKFSGNSNCTGCHDNSNKSHPKHLNSSIAAKNALTCADCHTATASSNTDLLPNTVKHINGAVEVVFDPTNIGINGNNYVAPTCLNIYCHSSGQASPTYSTVAWGAPSMVCNSCHGIGSTLGQPNYDNISSNRNSWNSHSPSGHVATAADCMTCHFSTTDALGGIKPDSTRHIDKARTVAFDTSKAGANAIYDGSSKTCSNVTCHNGFMPRWGGKYNCLLCHATLSGAHARHSGGLNLQAIPFYVYTANKSAGSDTDTVMAGYAYGCANCHPMDPTKHRNGIVEVDLTPAAGAGSLKLLNPNNSAPNGVLGNAVSTITCSNVYCHSGIDKDGNRYFTTTPLWSQTFTGDRCANCHGNSPASGAHSYHVVGIHYDSVSKGLGVFGNMSVVRAHGDPAQSTTINCNTCHVDTVTFARNKLNTACVPCHTSNTDGSSGLARIGNLAKHVNGAIDISFTPLSSFRSKAQLDNDSFAQYTSTYWRRNGNNYKNGPQAYDISKYSVTPGWNMANDTCSNVVCHMGVPVQWKTKEVECYDCHKAL